MFPRLLELGEKPANCWFVLGSRATIESLQPDARVRETPSADYRFRALVTLNALADSLVGRLAGIDYSNFKDSIPDPRRAVAYLKVWTEDRD